MISINYEINRLIQFALEKIREIVGEENATLVEV